MNSQSSLSEVLKNAKRLFAQQLANGECKLYELAETLVKHSVFPWSEDALIALYQKLFITQATLCRIDLDLSDSSDEVLVLTPISAKIVKPWGRESLSTEIQTDHTVFPNHAFFLDEAHFFNVTADQVEELLRGFWTQYARYESCDEAYQVLGLEPGADFSEVQAVYRRLARKTHPDRGGSAEEFISVRHAYETLCMSIQNR